jgi:hypothetical protein
MVGDSSNRGLVVEARGSGRAGRGDTAVPGLGEVRGGLVGG